MKNLFSVATGKIDVELIRMRTELDSQIEAMYRLHTSKGLLKSGNTMEETLKICDIAFQRLRNFLVTQFTWVFNESIFITQKNVEALKAITDLKFKEMLGSADGHLIKSGELTAKSGVYGYCLPRLALSNKNSMDEVILFIEGEALAKMNRGIRKFLNWIPNSLGKISGLFK